LHYRISGMHTNPRLCVLSVRREECFLLFFGFVCLRFVCLRFVFLRFVSYVSCRLCNRTKTGSSSLAVSLEMRRIKAKKLLLDVEARLGRNKMMKIFEVFKNTDEMALLECKNKLLEICQGHQDFQSRFLEFLPQQLRL
jgi:hypothetical protein